MNRQLDQPLDRAARRRVLLALSGLPLAFFLALYATGLREQGNVLPAAAAASISLLLAGTAAWYVVPRLARRTVLARSIVTIEYEVTREGLVYLALIAAIVIAALNTGNNLLFIILACLLAGIAVSGILSRIVLSEVRLEGSLPEHLFAGEVARSSVGLTNRKRFFPSFSMTVAAGSERSKPAALLRPILDQPVYFPFIPRQSSVTQRVELTFPRRGRYSQDGFRLSTKFPFGLLKKSRLGPARQEIVVLPSVRPTKELSELLPVIAGEMESYAKGGGHDLYAIRDYQPTDTARHIDWKTTAKARELKVREFAREDELRVRFVFDARLPEASPASLAGFEKAVNLAACLACHFCEAGAEIEFLTQELELPFARAADAVHPILEALAVVEPIYPAPHTEGGLLARLALDDPGFNLVFTALPGSHVPAELSRSSHVILMDSLA